jgi:hypothetical protein
MEKLKVWALANFFWIALVLAAAVAYLWWCVSKKKR